MALYVLPNGNGIVPLDTQANTPHTDPSRMFASAWGAGNHSDAPPVTPLKRKRLCFSCLHEVYTIDLGPK